MADEILLNEAAYAVWQTVEDKGPIELGEVVRLTGIDQAQVSAAATEAASGGHFKIDEREREELVATEGWKDIYANTPERRTAEWLSNIPNKSVPMATFVNWAKDSGIAVNEAFKWGSARGWINREKSKNETRISLTIGGSQGLKTPDDDYRALACTDFSERVYLDSLPMHGIKIDRVRALLGNRPELGKIKKRTVRIASLTPSGENAFKPNISLVTERNTLTPEDLESDAWREIKLRPYDVTLAARDVYPAKIHPLRKIIEQTRTAFLEMGFAEVVSPMVESAFWNFDALFQPQDHPAREMQDTFYMRHPAEAPLPGEVKGGEEKGVRTLLPERPEGCFAQKVPDLFLVEQVRRTHEDGWETGSEGWGYTWSPERSKQVVLRTHTTAATIRALAANPNPPGKFFCVGWTYRNETISFKHLPVFHQVDGIIIDEEANLASLMGTLQEFYSKMGFGRVKFKPAFYPYTEPSVDVVVYMESRGKWLEMGGAGIFRPEVTLPLGCKQPVLAWGLGIERLAMLRFGLSDIRELYRPSLDVLEGVPLCR